MALSRTFFAAVLLVGTALHAQSKPSTSQAAAQALTDVQVFAHASADTYWVAYSEPVGDVRDGIEHTVIRMRTAGDEGQWQLVTEVGGRVRSLADRGSQLVCVTADGGWVLAWPGGVSTGRNPANTSLLAVANEGDDLWAIGDRNGAPVPPTTAATEQAIGENPPAIPVVKSMQEGADHFVLLQMDQGNWIERAELPAWAGSGDGRQLLLAIVGKRPVVASVARAIHAASWDGHSWDDWDGLGLPVAPAHVQLMNISGRAALWVAYQGGAGALLFHGTKWEAPVALKAGPELAAATGPRAATEGFEKLRVVFTRQVKEGPQLWEQPFDLEGSPAGKAIQLTSPALDQTVNPWGTWLALAALMLVLLSTAGRRATAEQAVQLLSQVQLAPYGRRFAAGAVDAMPIIAVSIILSLRLHGDPNAPAEMRQPAYYVWPMLAVAACIFHTLLTELISGRSLGKFLFNLRVVSLNGQPPTSGQTVARNLMRIVDYMAGGFPLLVVMISPLRQRIGDLAAGTVVVDGRAKSEQTE